MLDYHLFLGFPLNTTYEERLNQVPQPLRILFIQSGKTEYLEQIERENQTYLGKRLDSLSEMQNIELLQTNIHSLLRRLIPDYSYDKHPLILLSIPIE